MIDYNKAVIYKISCNDINIENIYIGSSCNFTSRRSKHKKNTNNRVGKLYHLKLYKFIRDNGGWNNFKIEIIENYPCNNSIELIEREKYLIQLHNADLNTNLKN